MADDTTLFLDSINSLSIAINKFIQFQKYSGLELNISKTEVIPIGTNLGKDIVLAPELAEIKIKHGLFKALWVWFTHNQEKIIELNFSERLKNYIEHLDTMKFVL